MAHMVKSHWELDVYKKAFDVATALTELSRKFPREETYSLTDQLRKSARSVCANLAEAWRKRCCEAAFASKLNDAEGEAAETQVWIQFAVKCGYLDRATADQYFRACNEVIRILVTMRLKAEDWAFPAPSRSRKSQPK
ncbi:MAG TPA: four helix bundle protein [Gemmataceae bacterium]|nr:four helix bundle protein [Gemmataceae bacterium]